MPLRVPYAGEIPGGLKDGAEFIIYGTPTGDNFSINLCVGDNLDSGTAVHFNPRFDDNVVVKNTLSGGDWQSEDREGGFPFRQGDRFELRIKVAYGGYEFYVNKQHHSTYSHRMPYDHARHIVVQGNVDLESIKYQMEMK